MEVRGCEICGVDRVTWRGGIHICVVCSALYDQWREDQGDGDVRLYRFVAQLLSNQAGSPLAAAQKRVNEREGRR